VPERHKSPDEHIEELVEENEALQQRVAELEEALAASQRVEEYFDKLLVLYGLEIAELSEGQAAKILGVADDPVALREVRWGLIRVIKTVVREHRQAGGGDA
jgi:hypothetical protein